MKTDLAIFHYHLFPGGVTSVVSLSVRAILAHLPEVERITLVCGSDRHLKSLEHSIAEKVGDASARLSFDVVPELFYLSRESGSQTDGDLADREALKRLLRTRYGGALWWVHNYHLGKNPLFTEALLEIAEESPEQRMLFHIHDFPECARYDNLAFLESFIRLPLYPVSENVRYAVINNRDLTLLEQAGMPENRVVLLNNPVPPDELAHTDPRAVRKRLESSFAGRFPAYRPGAPLLFYPVRTIRRKNVLEAGLLAAISPEEANLIVTQPGVSEKELPYSRLVEESFAAGRIPGMWGVGTQLGEAGITFQELALSTDCVVSSSVQEGFGYLFIDGRRWRKPVFARYLDILDGIAEIIDGRSSYFYRELRVPIRSAARAKLRQAYHDRVRQIARFLPPDAASSLDETIGTTFSSDTVDFSYLAVSEQRDLLRRALDPAVRAELAELNREPVATLGTLLGSEVEDIGARIQGSFSLERFAETLRRIVHSYDEAEAAPRSAREAPAAAFAGGRIHRNLRAGFASLAYLRLLYE